jgi:hypothetical protein
MDTAWEPVGERFHKSDTVTFHYIPRQYYEILECAPEDKDFPYTLLKHRTSKLITFFNITEVDNITFLQKLNLPTVDVERKPNS